MTLNRLQFSDKDRTLPGMPLPYDMSVRPHPEPEKPRWSGIDRLQMVMGARNADFIQHSDQHGFIYEPTRDNWTGKRQVADADRDSGDQALHLYPSFGGSRRSSPQVQAHWESQPLHHIASDALIHTAQSMHETEGGRDPMMNEGRKRVDVINASLARGEEIQNPAWIVKHNERLYALDGHHRILASRESGKPTFPARVWDRDAERRS
jgi:hypothetical protein